MNPGSAGASIVFVGFVESVRRGSREPVTRLVQAIRREAFRTALEVCVIL